MQTDDVSTIAAQIANQAELIYQAWKTTDLNPNELIHYHSVTPDRSSPLRTNSPLQTPLTPPVSGPRIPFRSTSPAPLGSSSAVPRRVIEIPISTDRSAPIPSKSYGSPKQYEHAQQQHAPSPVRSLNSSPRPYIPPSTGPGSLFGSITESATTPQSPRVVHSSPSVIGNSSPRSFASQGYSSSKSLPSQPPPPPERSSSYVGGDSQASPSPSQQQAVEMGALKNSELEASLRELVNSFVQEDRARHSRPRSSSSPIRDALQRFERQAAITSRAGSPGENILSRSSPVPNSSQRFQQSNTGGSPFNSGSPNHTTNLSSSVTKFGSKNESKMTEGWNRRDSENRSRRSISPSPPPISQPGWNESHQSNTSTWPLKNKQSPSASSDKRASSPAPSLSSQSSSSGTVPTNYITTLETRVDSTGRSPGVPIRHKVVEVPSSTDKEEERLIQALRQGTFIDEGDSLRQVNSNDNKGVSGNTSVSAASDTLSLRKPKFSVSVTVDVEKKLTPSLSASGHLQKSEHDTPLWQGPPSPAQIEQLSNVDYAKVRFQDAQQRPRTTQRMEDYKSYSLKSSSNNDGRVMQVKNRFELSPAPPEAPWRIASSLGGEVGATLPEFYRRKLRKMRKSGSPEPLHALAAALPHPELTDQQKAHIRERSQSPTAALASSIAVRPFLTQGSVAERVLLFEKAPTELKRATNSVLIPEKRRPAFSTWKDPDEVRTKAQDYPSSPPSPSLAPFPSTATGHPLKQLEGAPASPASPGVTPQSPLSPLATANASKIIQNHLREATNSSPPSPVSSNKENARPSLSPTSPTLGGASTPLSPSSGNALSPTSPGTPSSLTHPLAGITGAQSPRASGRRLPKSTKNLLIPRFYYPMGRPVPQTSQDQHIQNVSQCFRDNGGQITMENMGLLTRACQVPLYWKAPLFSAAGGDKLSYLTQEQFTDYWGRVLSSCHDASSRFVRILSRGLRNYLLPEDFLGLIQDVVDTHPGLTFLKEATEFHSRYVHTVIARIYYCVNRSWSGRITVPELRRSNLLQVISYLEEEEDINKITDYFSYEHFYVIYCKFWELDTDHDLFIDKHDLAKHNDRALSWRIIERIFSGAVTRGRVQKQDRMGYQEFVWFLISEEDKRHPTAIEYWFRCMDLDGDGYLSMYELEYFYEEQLQRMEALGEILPFKDCLCQMLDMVRPAEDNTISLSDLKRCRMTPVFFDTFFNLEKYLDHEQRDPFASHRMDDEGTEMSDWDRYAAEEYELLVAEEGGGDQQDDMLYCDDDELSMGVDDILEGGEEDSLSLEVGGVGEEEENSEDSSAYSAIKGSLRKHSPLSATVTNLALDHMDVDEDYSDYADSDDYQY